MGKLVEGLKIAAYVAEILMASTALSNRPHKL